MKKRYFIPLVLVLGFTVAASSDDSGEYMRTDCVVQDKQVVINRYDGDHLITSTAFNNAYFKYWQRGSSKVVKANYRISYFDYRPFGVGEVVFTFIDDVYKTRYHSEWQVSRSCYDAVLEARYAS